MSWRWMFAFVGLAPLFASESAAPTTRESDNRGCIDCHSSIAAEHATSLHAAAFTDRSFQKGYSKEQKQFCRDCHMPEGSPAAGVTCVTCHRPDPDGPVLGVRASTRGHPVEAIPDFGTRACVRCHDFAFPGSESLGGKGKMQRTAEEHADSASTCSSCHMRSHRFGVSRDPDVLTRALGVRATRSADGDAVFTLTARGVGHAFPTGDLFRRLVLRATPTALESRPARPTLEYAFWRTFRADAEGRRFEATDNRLRPEQRVTVPIRGPLTWEVSYERVTAVAQTPPYEVDVEAALPLARGTLP